jgi:phosphatidate cytidylyltransferase
MALNLATFRTRALTAIVFVVVMLAGLLWNHWSFFILFSIIHIGCWVEYQRLIGKIDPDYSKISSFHKYGVIIAGWCIMLYFTNDAYTIASLSLHSVGWWLGLLFAFILPIMELLFTPNIQLKNIGYSGAGLLYISLSWGLMINLRSQGLEIILGSPVDFGWVLPTVLIATIWINDTMAYIVGSLIGKTPFSSISPKKTWEGTAGGAILAIIAISISMIYILPNSGFWFWIGFTIIATVVGTAGDLLESKLKRMANVKDSGQIMPGHGGFLDRFDSLLLATPFVSVYVMLALS